MKRLSLLLSFIVVFAACATVRLESRLPVDIRAWYDQHWIIMEYPVPKNMGGKSERHYFLHLSPGLQRKYIQQFWEIREVGAEEEYALRLAVCKRWFKGEGIDPWNTDMGRIMLLVGQPFDEQFRDEVGEYYNEGDEEWGAGLMEGKQYFRLWLYWWGSGFFQQIVTVRFQYDQKSQTWRWLESTDKTDQDFMQYWRWRMSPTKDGWKAWAAEAGK